MALATMSSALSGESGPIRRRACRAATAPATMLTIQPTTTRRKIRLNMASSFSVGPTTAPDLSAYSVRSVESAPRDGEQVLRLEADKVPGARQIERDLTALDRSTQAGGRMESREEVGGELGRIRVRGHDVDHGAAGHVALEREGESTGRVADVEIRPELVGEDRRVRGDGRGTGDLGVHRTRVRDAQRDHLVAVAALHGG